MSGPQDSMNDPGSFMNERIKTTVCDWLLRRLVLFIVMSRVTFQEDALKLNILFLKIGIPKANKIVNNEKKQNENERTNNFNEPFTKLFIRSSWSAKTSISRMKRKNVNNFLIS